MRLLFRFFRGLSLLFGIGLLAYLIFSSAGTTHATLEEESQSGYLQVNGSDGPVGIVKGSSVPVSWSGLSDKGDCSITSEGGFYLSIPSADLDSGSRDFTINQAQFFSLYCRSDINEFYDNVEVTLSTDGSGPSTVTADVWAEYGTTKVGNAASGNAQSFTVNSGQIINIKYVCSAGASGTIVDSSKVNNYSVTVKTTWTLTCTNSGSSAKDTITADLASEPTPTLPTVKLYLLRAGSTTFEPAPYEYKAATDSKYSLKADVANAPYGCAYYFDRGTPIARWEIGRTYEFTIGQSDSFRLSCSAGGTANTQVSLVVGPSDGTNPTPTPTPGTQDFTITVVDSINQETTTNVKVTVKGDNDEISDTKTTDSNGKAIFNDIPITGRDYVATAEYTDQYTAESVSVPALSDGKNYIITLWLRNHTPSRMTGKVGDQNGKGVPYVRVGLFKYSTEDQLPYIHEESFVTYVTTSENGEYLFDMSSLIFQDGTSSKVFAAIYDMEECKDSQYRNCAVIKKGLSTLGFAKSADIDFSSPEGEVYDNVDILYSIDYFLPTDIVLDMEIYGINKNIMQPYPMPYNQVNIKVIDQNGKEVSEGITKLHEEGNPINVISIHISGYNYNSLLGKKWTFKVTADKYEEHNIRWIFEYVSNNRTDFYHSEVRVTLQTNESCPTMILSDGTKVSLCGDKVSKIILADQNKYKAYFEKILQLVKERNLADGINLDNIDNWAISEFAKYRQSDWSNVDAGAAYGAENISVDENKCIPREYLMFEFSTVLQFLNTRDADWLISYYTHELGHRKDFYNYKGCNWASLQDGFKNFVPPRNKNRGFWYATDPEENHYNETNDQELYAETYSSDNVPDFRNKMMAKAAKLNTEDRMIFEKILGLVRSHERIY